MALLYQLILIMLIIKNFFGSSTRATSRQPMRRRPSRRINRMLTTAAGAKLLFLVLLGPVAALYDLATNPNAPPQIFAAQASEAFRPTPHPHVTVTRP
jgi:hypothetical protein